MRCQPSTFTSFIYKRTTQNVDISRIQIVHKIQYKIYIAQYNTIQLQSYTAIKTYKKHRYKNTFTIFSLVTASTPISASPHHCEDISDKPWVNTISSSHWSWLGRHLKYASLDIRYSCSSNAANNTGNNMLDGLTREISHVMFTLSTTVVVQYAKMIWGRSGFASLVKQFISKWDYILVPPSSKLLSAPWR